MGPQSELKLVMENPSLVYPYAPSMESMEYLPTSTLKSRLNLGRYTIHGVYQHINRYQKIIIDPTVYGDDLMCIPCSCQTLCCSTGHSHVT